MLYELESMWDGNFGRMRFAETSNNLLNGNSKQLHSYLYRIELRTKEIQKAEIFVLHIFEKISRSAEM